MFDTLEEQIEQTDPGEAKGRWKWFVGAGLITLVIFAVLGAAMWIYK